MDSVVEEENDIITRLLINEKTCDSSFNRRKCLDGVFVLGYHLFGGLRAHVNVEEQNYFSG